MAWAHRNPAVMRQLRDQASCKHQQAYWQTALDTESPQAAYYAMAQSQRDDDPARFAVLDKLDLDNGVTINAPVWNKPLMNKVDFAQPGFGVGFTPIPMVSF